MRNRWTRNRIDYHPCITSEPTNQVTDYQNARLGVLILDYKSVNEINIRLCKRPSSSIIKTSDRVFETPSRVF